jgi:hypothetical protein
MELYEYLIEFVNERELIRKNKEAGIQPYTQNEILNKYRFCNVRRKDDRVTRWLLQHYYTNNIGDVWFKAMIARLINWPPTLKHLLEKDAIPHRVEEFDVDYFIECLEKLKEKNIKMFSSAYVVYPTRLEGTKSENMSNHIIAPLSKKAEDIRAAIEQNSIELVTDTLATCFGIKTFIAGQVSADLTYIMGQLLNAKDLYTYAPKGPGSQRGLNRLHERYLKATFKNNQFNEELMEAREKLIWSNPELEDLTLHDVQNIMCEFDKYLRVKFNEGKPKQIYKPTWEF